MFVLLLAHAPSHAACAVLSIVQAQQHYVNFVADTWPTFGALYYFAEVSAVLGLL